MTSTSTPGSSEMLVYVRASSENAEARKARTHDLLDDLGRRVEVDEALVHLELVAVPRLGALTARRLARRDLERLGREADGALDAQRLVLGAVHEVAADCALVSLRATRAGLEHDAHFSRFLTFELVSVILILWTLGAGTGAPVASYSFSPFAT